MQLKLIACEIFYREICAAVARSPNQVDLQFLPKGLHDIGNPGMLERLQDALGAVKEDRYEAVLLGYGLCNNGVVGLRAGKIPVVLPRAHDCIALFFGSRQRYNAYFNEHPGVYFKTSGWVERGGSAGELSQLSIAHKAGMDMTYEELVARYGEDNAKFLHEQLCDMTRNYTQFTFIEMGVEPSEQFERQVREEAAGRGWRFEKIRGDMALIQRLVDGPWDEGDFLVVPPGRQVAVDYGEGIVKAVEPRT
jgi:hypothetical protein